MWSSMSMQSRQPSVDLSAINHPPNATWNDWWMENFTTYCLKWLVQVLSPLLERFNNFPKAQWHRTSAFPDWLLWYGMVVTGKACTAVGLGLQMHECASAFTHTKYNMKTTAKVMSTRCLSGLSIHRDAISNEPLPDGWQNRTANFSAAA